MHGALRGGERGPGPGAESASRRRLRHSPASLARGSPVTERHVPHTDRGVMATVPIYPTGLRNSQTGDGPRSAL